MEIKFKLKVDQKQQMYWSGICMHNNNVVLEVISQTFNPNNLVAYRDAYERCTVRMMKELAKDKDQTVIQHMLLEPNN